MSDHLPVRPVKAGQIWRAREDYRERLNLPPRFVVVLRVEAEEFANVGGFVFVRNIGPATGIPYGRTNRIYTGRLSRDYEFVREQWEHSEPGQP